MTESSKDIEAGLAAFFAAEKATDLQPDAALLAAILQDADAMQPAPASFSRPVASQSGWSRDFWDALGGWASAGTLTACLILGAALGYTPPQGLTDLTDTVLESAGFLVSENDGISLDDLLVEG